MADLDMDRDLADELAERRLSREWRTCPRCHGDGLGSNWDGTCPRCRGEGSFRVPEGDDAA